MRPVPGLCALSALLLTAAVLVQSELITGSSELQTVFALEQSVVPLLSNYIDRTEEKLAKLKSYLQQYGEVESDLYHYDGDNFLERIAGNPVHAFHLTKRFASDWRRIQNMMRKDQWSDVAKQIDSLKLGARLPKETDMEGMARALVRLHDTYDLDLDRLARGDMLGVQTAAILTAQDCLYMGKSSFLQGMYWRSVQWYDTALRLAEQEHNRTVTATQINELAQRARLAHDMAASKPNHTNVYVLSEPLNGRSPAEVHRHHQHQHQFRLGTSIPPEQDFINYKALCRGEQLLHPKEVAKLRCWNSDRGHAYFKLRPIKVEQKHIDPDLVLFHDVILDKEMETIKRVSKDELTRSMVVGGRTGDKVSDSRISRTAWLDDTQDPVVAAVSRRVAAITGLATDVGRGEAETFQISRYSGGGHYLLHFDTKYAFRRIVNYGIGGHYKYHEDFLFKTEQAKQHVEHTPSYQQSGDRIATFMFYLSDVVRGGATAFPKLGVSVFPEKGAAAFWYNLRRNGRGDVRTLHGGCPVAYGSKWIANKWIRERPQFRQRPCALNPTE